MKLEIDDPEALSYCDMKVRIPNTDASAEMLSAMAEFCFPNLYALCDAKETDGALPTKELRKALMADLDPLFEAHWKHAALRKRADFESRLAVDLDMDPRLVRVHRSKRAEVLGTEEEEAPSPPGQERAAQVKRKASSTNKPARKPQVPKRKSGPRPPAGRSKG